ncbi:hypothetical protein CBS101457_001367 [Exobasidium rhododendri]|nr:hypothetical protein CBS101457_001367 [Exobasidium rhododendri]
MLLTRQFALLASLLVASTQAGIVPSHQLVKRDTSVTFDGRTFVNHGLVGFGRINASAVDSYGETLGGIGSSIALESLNVQRDGSYAGNIRLNPDRGHNTQTTTDYRSRSHEFSFTFKPTVGNSTAENVALKYGSSTLYRIGADLNYTTGLDSSAVRAATFLSPALPVAPSDNHVSFDQEGFAFSKDGLFAFLSDEYGPYIYTTDRTTGIVLSTLAPPPAIVPMIGGKINFTSEVNPDTGRAPNQGFEGLTLDHNTNTLWALLQSATIQDSVGGSKTTNRYTRMFGYDVSNPLKPTLVSEYVVPLPQSKKLATRASSELHIVDSTTFLILSRDGNGFGDTSSDTSFKDADLISTKGATNIANTPFDQPANPVAPGGVLNSAVTPVTYSAFINLIDPVQLAKFGLHIGGAFDNNLIASKLESLAVAPIPNSNNQLLFVVSDNDFITANGHQAAEVNGKYVLQAYADPYALQYGDGNTQVFIYNVTLPGYSQGPLPN